MQVYPLKKKTQNKQTWIFKEYLIEELENILNIQNTSLQLKWQTKM